MARKKVPHAMQAMLAMNATAEEIAARLDLSISSARVYASMAGYLCTPIGCLSEAQVLDLDSRMTRADLVKHLGYQKDGKRAVSIFLRRQAGKRFVHEPKEAPKPLQVPEMSGHPFWTPDLDRMVMVNCGTYEGLRAVAEKLGKPCSYVQQRYHLLRSAA